jgi:hypothetical protein
VIIALVLIIRDRRGEHSGPTPPQAPARTEGSTMPAYATAPNTAGTTEDTAVFEGGQPPAWQPPVARPPLVPPHPKRTGVIWFWPTLALIAVALGVLGLYDNSNHVTDGAYPALALGITAVMLLVGSFRGRPGGLILLGFLATIALAGNVAVGGKFGVDAKEIDQTPATAAAVQSEYENTVGEIRLDLTEVSDPEALAGREIDMHLRTGSIEVIVPRTLNVHVDAKMDFAGGIKVPGDDGGGFNHEVDTNLVAVPASTSAPLELDLDAKLGQITVEYR